MKLSAAVLRLAVSAAAIAPIISAIDTYDVVIIGSGPGGLVAAEYLSRDPFVKVLVLEAGGPSLQESGGTDGPAYAKSKGFTKFDIPGEYDGVGSIFNNINAGYRVDWISDEPSFLGKLVGGCSSINAALYFRTPDSYIVNSKWPYDPARVTDGFDALEQMFGHTDNPSPDGKYYLQEAYNIVSTAFKQRGQYTEVSINAAAARNNKHKTFGHAPFAFKDGLRDSPAKVSVRALKGRTNAKLVTFATASYIKHYRGLATGVVYNNNVEVGLSTNGAVIMAAGAMSTPKVLIQSGIGPIDQLNLLSKRSDFPGVLQTAATKGWVINENVGKNLFDTNAVFASFSHPQMKAVLDKQSQQSAIDQYMTQNQTGILALSGPVLIGYENYMVNNRLYEFQTTISPNGFGEFKSNVNAFFAALYINNPESRDYSSFNAEGKWVGFTTKNVVMSSENDVAAMKSYTNKVVSMLQQNGATFLSANAGESVDAWVDRNKAWKTNHFGGSCYASGDLADTKRCVDNSLRVVGTTNIFVADASLQKEGTVNPYGFIMYAGYEAGNVVQAYLTNGPPSPVFCNAGTIQKDVDFIGLDIGNAPSDTAAGCCAVCQNTNGCQVFSWTNANGGTCYLKSAVGATVAKVGVFSSAVRTVPPPTPTCASIDENVDYVANDVGSVAAAKAEDCCVLCTGREGCGAFSWNSFNGGTCWLKSGKGETIVKTGTRSAVLSSTPITPTPTTPTPTTPTPTTPTPSTPTPSTPTPTTPTPTTPTPTTCPTIEDNLDYTGNDVGNVLSDRAEGCCAHCRSNAACRAFTWTNFNGGTCWLKGAKGATKTSSGARSAEIRSSCSTIQENVDYAGADVGNVLGATAEACCSQCRARADCKAYTWTNFNGGTCWLKSAKGTATVTNGARSATLL